MVAKSFIAEMCCVLSEQDGHSVVGWGWGGGGGCRSRAIYSYSEVVHLGEMDAAPFQTRAMRRLHSFVHDLLTL